VLSDRWGLTAALTATPLFAIVAAVAFLLAARSYEADKARAAEPLADEHVPRVRAAVA
jgi:MFS transporter, Spinster family, sphingosine-1-phosphate transporter